MGRPPLVGGTSNSWDSANSCQLRGWLPQWTNTTCDGRFHGRWQRPRCSHWPRVDRRWTSCRYNTLIVPSTHDAISWGMVMYENENNEGEVSISCCCCHYYYYSYSYLLLLLMLLLLLLLLLMLLQLVHKIEPLGFVEQVCYRMNDALPVTEPTASKQWKPESKVS